MTRKLQVSFESRWSLPGYRFRTNTPMTYGIVRRWGSRGWMAQTTEAADGATVVGGNSRWAATRRGAVEASVAASINPEARA